MARGFDGVDDYITVANEANFDILGDMTITAWIKPMTTGVWQYIVSKMNEATGGAANHPFQFALKNVDKLCFYSGDGTSYVGGVYDASTLSSGVWYHVAVVYVKASGDVTIYLNGSGETDANTPIGNRVNTDYPVRIGRTRFNSAWYYPFEGNIAEVRIYDRALGANEILHCMYSRILDTNLLLDMPLWGVASPEPDLSGDQNNGTVTGAVLADHAPVGPYTMPFSPRSIG